MNAFPPLPGTGFHRTGTQVETERLLGALAADMREYAIFALDADGRVTTWNRGAQLIKQYTSEEIIGRHFSTFYPAEYIASGYPTWELEQAAAHGFFIDRGWRLRKDGSAFWAHVVITAQRTTDGTLDGFIKVTRDESEAFAQRERSDRRFTDLFQLAPTGIALLDERDRILDANGALCELLGYRPHGLVAAELMHPLDGVAGLVPRAVPPGHDRAPGSVAQRRLAQAGGQPMWCEVRCAASVDHDGNRFWLAVFQDLTEQVRRTETLHFQATHDQPTGLLNRRGVNEVLAPLLSADTAGRVGVLFCDLDNFKRFNDSLGHDAGDELMATLARRLVDELPESCTPARLYGDEFLVICSNLPGCGGMEALHRTVSDILCATTPLRGRLLSVTATFGAATAQDGITPAELIRSADAAMLQAKRRGHGRTAPASAPAQLALEEELREALAHDGLELHFQPVFRRDGSITLAEALVRWPHPERGLLRPDTILPVATQGGMLADLDRWVLRAALREATGWQRIGGRAPGVAVNLSGLSPEDDGFHEEITSEIAASGIEPGRVVLEMVETVLVELPARPRGVMSGLARDGVRFAMDDFGTGYSSLARLKDLPTQIVKLDRRFVSGMGTDPVDLGITRAVIELSHAMGRMCIAEGVENTTQHDLLDHLGVDAYQGFLFAHPAPAENLRALLANSARA
ncbi:MULTISPECIES: bifunctional diguanylate cyclase/phosphodiesterase [unclassified Saccharopolyspora]|uniref:putative bifunctional diguanylate cyclase/phosphodiesterase n=1 Tax=unclassified Saccharopolyspora TaxID=2646250 RepID=UPI001CD35916|nr:MULTISPECIES: bifunctional diguanylate cyclase/phosphodiesterase [unclassified Saccharopolyspora]MCA1185215.1 EAL domain-containing protein [Saccharopolyspora sp. 6T]MCA1278930.1 EAL domain-containing protein [Saccharopolyspora sp. 7B]